MADYTTAQLPPPDIMDSSSPSPKPHLLWTEKYRAKRFTDLITDDRTSRQVLRWLKSWDSLVFPSGAGSSKKQLPPPQKKILLISGPPGLGKTTLAHVAARQAGYNTVEINASDSRTADVVRNQIRDIMSYTTVSFDRASVRPAAIVIDEIDGVDGNKESGFIKALIDLIQLDHTNANRQPGTYGTRRRKRKGDDFRFLRPIVAVCNDLYAPALKPLRPFADVVYMRKPPAGAIASRMKGIFGREGFECDDSAARRLVELACKGGGSGGDLRGALVGGELMAQRLNANLAGRRQGGRKILVTRDMVDSEMGAFGAADGSGKGKGGVREVIEKVFCLPKVKAGMEGVKPIEELRQCVETCAEFDKIITDCFATYPDQPYHDDTFLTKPTLASDWLFFHDLLSTAQLSQYLPTPILAFHTLFATLTNSGISTFGDRKPLFGEDDPEPAPFTGTKADYDCFEGRKATRTTIQSLQSSISNLRLMQAFKSDLAITTELAPYLTRIFSPKVTPVVIRGSGPNAISVASVRREDEKKLVHKVACIMLSLGIEFEKVKIDDTHLPVGPVGRGVDYAYRMDPPLDTLNSFVTRAEKEKEVTRYAVRQVIHQECEREKLAREVSRRNLRFGEVEHPLAASAEPIKVAVKRDFWGNVVEENAEGDGKRGGGDVQADGRKRRRVVRGHGGLVWVQFHDGYSNAVRKGVSLEDLVRSFF
ncbi:P-loop containing nucleoside triphosphate hydrolase protein [Ascobolus immersus RN42]|uniref:P-loop containing nucleoside triphosphate hydrolase protein n=1 Tax=Ascobolus immersus RN42 TaxID=1160509 RepID=A0A3N4I1W1_ASCIM|nr:P-loop containing nucleoside triphosphate hydrolase protein [Ascobolus immersus RN42]